MIYTFKPHITGDTFRGIEFEILVNSVPLDLTEYRICMQMRSTHNNKQVTFEFSTENEGEEEGGVITIFGVNRIRFEPCIIKIAPQTYVYDIEFESPDGVKRTWVEGTWTIKPDVTRCS